MRIAAVLLSCFVPHQRPGSGGQGNGEVVPTGGCRDLFLLLPNGFLSFGNHQRILTGADVSKSCVEFRRRLDVGPIRTVSGSAFHRV